MGLDRSTNVVNRLVAICREGEAAYRTAAEKLTDLHGQALLMDLAEKRSLSAAALAGLTAKDVQPAPRGVPGDPPLLPAPPMPADAMAMVRHLREVEERTLDELDRALALDLPMDVRTAVDQQYRAVRRAYGRLATFPSAIS